MRRILLAAFGILKVLPLETRRTVIEAEIAPAAAAPETALLGLIVALPRAAMVEFFIAVSGGSGRGLMPADGVETVLFRLMGDSLKVFDLTVDPMEDFWPVTNSCLMASSGFIRRSGSQRKQRVRKSRKASSSHLRTC